MEVGRRRRRSASPPPRNLLSWDDYVHTLPYVLDISDLSWDDDDAPLTLHTYVPYVHAATGTVRYTEVEVLLPVNNSNKRARVADDDDDTVLRRQLPEVAPGSGDDDCAICLQDLVGSPEKEEEATPRAMPCSHAFHERCIFPWLRRNLACPLCRRPLPTPQQKKPSPPPQQYDHHDEDLPTPPPPQQQQHDYHDDDRLQMTMPVPR